MMHWIQTHLPDKYRLHFSKAEHLHETFVGQPYRWLALRLKPNTTVIDIGASIGDTAIYFAQFPNVSKVIAFEPTPGLAQGASEILSKCPLAERIDFRNAAVSNKEGNMKATTDVLGGKQASTMKGTGKNIKVYSLNEITKDIAGPIAIKSDCEGDERLIFPDADLSKVYAIMLEDHFNCRDEMEGIFKGKGFKTVRLTPLNEMGCGMIGAWRE